MNKKTQTQKTVQNKKARLLTAPTLMVTSVAMAAASQALASDTWKANPEVFYTGGTDRWYAGGQILYPIKQSNNSLTYADLRFVDSRFDTTEYNVGVGHRILGDGGIMGGYLSYDGRKTTNDNKFNQITLGLEYLAENWDVNFNYYSSRTDAKVAFIPATSVSTTESSSETVEELTSAVFVENSLMATYTATETVTNQITTVSTAANNIFEEAMSGYDLELGYLLPFSQDNETRFYLAAYSFEADESSYFQGRPVDPDDAAGVRARLEFRPQKALTLGVAYQDDDMFGSQTFGSVTYSFGYEGKGRRSLSERMVELHERDIDIVTHSNLDDHGNVLDGIGNVERFRTTVVLETEVETPVVTTATEAIDENEDGEADDIIHIDNSYTGGNSDGSFEAPFVSFNDCYDDTACTTADIMYVHQGDSATAGSEYDRPLAIELERGQMLLGEGAEFFGLGGGLFPILTNTNSNRDLVTLNQNNTVAGLQFEIVGNGADAEIFAIHGEDVKYTFIHDNRIIGNSLGTSGATGIFLEYNFGKRNSGLKPGKSTSAQIIDNVIVSMDDNGSSGSRAGHGILVETKFFDEGVFTQTFNLTGNEIASNNSVGVMVYNYIADQAVTLNQAIDLSNAELTDNHKGVYLDTFASIGLYTSVQSLGLNQSIDLRGATVTNSSDDAIEIYSDLNVYGSAGLDHSDLDIFANFDIVGDSETRITNNNSHGLKMFSSLYTYNIDHVRAEHTLDLDFDGVELSQNYEGVDIDMSSGMSMGTYIESNLIQNINIANSNINNNDNGSGFVLSAYIINESAHIAMSVLEQNVTVSNSNFDDNSGALTIYGDLYQGGNSSAYNSNRLTQNLTVTDSTFNNSESNGITLAGYLEIEDIRRSSVAFEQNVNLTNVEATNTRSTGVYIENDIYIESQGGGRNTVDVSLNLNMDNVNISTPDGSHGLEVDHEADLETSARTVWNEAVNVNITNSDFSNSDYDGVRIDVEGDLDSGGLLVADRLVDVNISNTMANNVQSHGIYVNVDWDVDVAPNSTIDNMVSVVIDNVQATGAGSVGLYIYTENEFETAGGSILSDTLTVNVSNSNFSGAESYGINIEHDLEYSSGGAVQIASLMDVQIYNVEASDVLWSHGITVEDDVDIDYAYYSDLAFTANVDLTNIDATNAYSAGVYVELDAELIYVGGSTVAMNANVNMDNINVDGAISRGLYLGEDFSIGGDGVIATIDVNNVFNNISALGPESIAIGLGFELYLEGEGNQVAFNDTTSLTNSVANSRDYSAAYLEFDLETDDADDLRLQANHSVTVSDNDFDGYSGGLRLTREIDVDSSDDNIKMDVVAMQTVNDNTFASRDSFGAYIYNSFWTGSSSDYLDFSWDLTREFNNNNVDASSYGVMLADVFSVGSSTDDSFFDFTRVQNVTGNTITNNKGVGLYFESGFYAPSSADYVHMTFSDTTTIANNTITNNSSKGLYIDNQLDAGGGYNTMVASQALTITNNTVTGNGSVNLYINEDMSGGVDMTQTVLIDGNDFSNAEYSNVYVDTSIYGSSLTRTLSFTNNMVNNSNSMGLALDNNVGWYASLDDTLLFSGNELNNNGVNGLYISTDVSGTSAAFNSSVEISNNEANGNGFTGLRTNTWVNGGTYASALQDISIIGNTANNNWNGISVYSSAGDATSSNSAGVEISNNTVTGNSFSGVTFFGYGNSAYNTNVIDVSLNNNNLSNNTGNGLNLWASLGTEIDATMTTNIIDSNGGNGVYIWADSGTDLAGPDAITTINLSARGGNNSIQDNVGDGVRITTNQNRDEVDVTFNAAPGNTANTVNNSGVDDFSVYGPSKNLRVIDDEGNKVTDD